MPRCPTCGQPIPPPELSAPEVRALRLLFKTPADPVPVNMAAAHGHEEAITTLRDRGLAMLWKGRGYCLTQEGHETAARLSRHWQDDPE